jgi:hypothetical protein
MLARALVAANDAVRDESDALAGLALAYRARSARFVAAGPMAAAGVAPADGQTAAADIVWRFHSCIYFTTMRALVGKALADAGNSDRRDDANVWAGQALAAIEQSRAALQRLRDEGDEHRALVALLDAITRGIDERFSGDRIEVRRPAARRLQGSPPRLRRQGQTDREKADY